jgi:Ribosomally synthesized peptide prototyped by Frankia Franean1_4349.
MHRQELERRPQYARGMTHRNVENLIGRLATDPSLRRRFVDDPPGLLHELREQGYELTAVELDALASTDATALRSFADTLDRRIRRAAVASEQPDNANDVKGR